MERIQIGNRLELSTDSHEKLGEILVLKATDGDKGTIFEQIETEYEAGEGYVLTGVGIRISKETAKLLAAELLNFASEES